MLMSVDGKISTGAEDQRVFDKDFPTLPELAKWLHQYYELEQETDLRSLNSSKVMKKIWMNTFSEKNISKTPVHFVLIDNGELIEKWLQNMVKKSNILYLATTKKRKSLDKNIICDYYEKRVDLHKYLEKLYDYGCKSLTIQTGSSINEKLLRLGLIDYISIVVAPCLIWGKDTPSLIWWKSLKTTKDIEKIKTLELLECKKLKNSYVHFIYKIKN